MLSFTPSQWYLGYALRKVEDNIPVYNQGRTKIMRYTTRVSWEAYAPDGECKFEASTLTEIKDLVKGDLL